MVLRCDCWYGRLFIYVPWASLFGYPQISVGSIVFYNFVVFGIIFVFWCLCVLGVYGWILWVGCCLFMVACGWFDVGFNSVVRCGSFALMAVMSGSCVVFPETCL